MKSTKHLTSLLLFPAFIIIVMHIAGCGAEAKKNSSDLEKKREELAKLNNDLNVLQEKIAALEVEVSQSDKSILENVKARPVGIDTVKKTDFLHYIEVQGTVDAEQNVLSSPYAPGVVTSILVNEGDYVTKGQLLATLDNAAILRGIEEAETGLAFATTAYEKQKKLWEQNIGSEITFLQAKNQKEQLEKKIQTLKTQAAMYTIISQINGVVDEVRIKLGEMASPGMSGIRVVNLDKLTVKAKLGETYIDKVKKGDKVKLYFPDLDAYAESEITYVSRQIVANSRSLLIEASLTKKPENVKANQIAKLMINDALFKDAIVVPTNVIQTSAEGQYVLVAESKDGFQVAKRVAVTPGLSYAGRTLIESGLNGNERLITFGYSEIVDGQKISF